MDGLTKKILVVEDEEKIVSVIKSFLEMKGFQVICAENGVKAIELFQRERVSLVLLDLMLPEMTGEKVCQILRQKSNVPIIMLTAKSDEADMLRGLEIGADDYITKPFRLMALYARIEAVLRRAGEDPTSFVNKEISSQEDILIDYENRSIIKNSEEIKLTPNEYKILAALLKSPNRVFTREELITAAFGNEFDGYDRTIDSHIKNLRAKIEKDSRNPTYIKTIHGVGYKYGGE